MRVDIEEEAPSDLLDYSTISTAFLVERILDFEDDGDELRVSERLVEEPFWKDYDALEAPVTWVQRFDISRWGLLGAFVDNRRVGGALIAFDSAGVEILEGRKDLAVLWDLRVHAEYRRKGVGAALFRAVEDWAAAKGCIELKIETQNTNLPACRFYERQGCSLRQVNPGAYPALPDEVQLIWSKTPRAFRL
jgi:GNAT superfamily N-acetyltransferase